MVSILRAQNHINDTWNELNRTLFDLESAKRQELHNRITCLDVQFAIMDISTTVVKKSDQLNMNDLIYVLSCQLGLLMSKRFGLDEIIAWHSISYFVGSTI